MKKIIIIFFILSSFTVIKAQKTIYEPQFVSISSDTFKIFKGDEISNVAIVIPEFAEDSSEVRGGIRKIGKFTTGTIKLGSGDSYSIGYDDEMSLDSVFIIPKSRINLILTPKKGHGND